MMVAYSQPMPSPFICSPREAVHGVDAAPTTRRREVRSRDYLYVSLSFRGVDFSGTTLGHGGRAGQRDGAWAARGRRCGRGVLGLLAGSGAFLAHGAWLRQ